MSPADILLTVMYYPFIEPIKTALLVVLLVFLWMAIRDLFQTKSSINRNFPLFGMGRYLIATAGPCLLYTSPSPRD